MQGPPGGPKKGSEFGPGGKVSGSFFKRGAGSVAMAEFCLEGKI